MCKIGGTIVLFDRKMLRNFRKDGHNWKKKNDGKTVKEAHEHLKVRILTFLGVYLKFYGSKQPIVVYRTCIKGVLMVSTFSYIEFGLFLMVSPKWSFLLVFYVLLCPPPLSLLIGLLKWYCRNFWFFQRQMASFECSQPT